MLVEYSYYVIEKIIREKKLITLTSWDESTQHSYR